MNWLIPSIVSTFIGSVMLFLVYLYLYFRENDKKPLLNWVIAWGFYSIRFLSMLLYVDGGKTNEIYLFFNLLCSQLSGVFLFQGTFLLIHKKINKVVFIASDVLILYLIIGMLMNFSHSVITTPIYFFLGSVFIYTGFIFYKNVSQKTFENNITALLFILWGIHKFDYPFLIENKEYAPFGYIVGALLAILVAFAICLNYLQRAKNDLKNKEAVLTKRNEENEFHKERLERLLRISQMKTSSRDELISYALEEAIALTKSKIGYIYFYNEENKKFTLNARSQEVMKMCKVVDKQTLYSLEKTGIWGEAVRQRKPILINNFTAPHPHKKGLPEGHVVLNRFLTIPVFDKDEIVAVVGVANKDIDYDNTDIKQLQLLMDNVWRIAEQFRLINDLEKALNKAKESDKLKSAFLQNLSHEIRTPMNGIIGFSKLLAMGEIDINKKLEYTDIIIRSSDQLLSIVNNIITISSLETKQEVKNVSPVKVNNITNDLYLQFAEKVKTEKFSFNVYNDLNDSDSEILTDGIRLQQILFNLIDNAIKFTETGAIEFGYVVKENIFEFYVKDSGIGIEEKYHKVIFQNFRQANYFIAQNYGGNGLGLSIAQGLVKLLGGEIWLESTVGVGTTVYFTISYSKTDYSTKLENNNDNIRKDKKAKSGLHILIAEDTITNYLLIEELFENTKHTLIHAKNGKQAVDVCEKNKDIDLVLMDIKMPILDGYEATKKIKRFRKDLLIIAQTAYALDNEKVKFEKVFDGYITKPINKEELDQIISSIMQNNL